MEMYPEDGWEWTPLPSQKTEEDNVYLEYDPYINANTDDYDWSDCILASPSYWEEYSENDVLNFDMEWNYSEGATLALLEDYLRGTYGAHYTNDGSKIQTLDFIESIGDAEAFCRSNAIKYLSRFGKKDGKNPKDLLKVMHYAILLYHFAGLHSGETN